MLEKPNLSNESIIACLQHGYGLAVRTITFLPLGADVNTAVYRAVAADGNAYFVKLRSGRFDETSVTLPKLFHDQGIAQIIVPLTTRSGQLWATVDAFTVILYPFVEGRNANEVALSDELWQVFGAALKRVHTTTIPPALGQQIQRERFSPQAREAVKAFLARVAVERRPEPVAAQTAAFLQEKHAEILDLIAHAERCAHLLQASMPDFVVCHSDIHAWNLLIDSSNHLYMVDWDNPIWAPKERDLMFIGSGLGFAGNRTLQAEEALFYQGYGETPINAAALAYYRYERIVQDIWEFGKQLLLTDAGGDDREQSLRYLMSNFLPDGTIAIAYASDKTLSR
ncbi:MAG: phosphotransferase [Caldilineaceae bacterium]